MYDRAARHSRRGPGAAAHRRAALERAGYVLTAVAILHGVVVLTLGWGLDVAAARGEFVGLKPISPLTALGFVGAGGALLLLASQAKKGFVAAGRTLAAAVALLGGLVLLEYASGHHSGVGDLLFRERLAGFDPAIVGLPAPNSALCFLLFGGALLTLQPPRVRSPFLEWFTLPVGFIALQALIGYAYGAEPLYRLSAFAPIPLPTAAGFLLLAGAVLCMRPGQGLVAQLTAGDAGGFVARRLLMPSLLLPLLIGWIGLQGLRQGVFSLEVGTALIVAVGIFAVTGAVWTSTRALSRADRRRRSATTALRASVGRLRRAVEMSPFPQMIHAEDGQVLQISNSWSELTGYTPDELPTVDAWTERAFGEDSPALRLQIESLYDLERRADAEGGFQVRTRTGEMRTWQFSSAPLGRLRDGRRLVISAAADVTERTAAEEQLRRSNRRLAFLFDATSRLLASRDPLQLIRVLYGEVAELLALDVYFHYMVRATRNGRRLELASWAGVTEPDAAQLRRQEFGEPVCGTVAATRRRMICESAPGTAAAMPARLRALGVRAYVCHPLIAREELVGTLSFGSRSRHRFTREELGLLQAVADQVALALDRAQADERERMARLGAEQASRAKDHFLAVVSHELRTPLTAVVGYTDLLQANVSGVLNEAQKRFVERIRESAWSLASVIDEILTFARTQARQEEVKAERTDAVRIAREAIGAVHPEAVRKGLLLECALPTSPGIVHTDGPKLRRIIMNLVSNAVKFTDEGRVRVDMRLTDSVLRVSVSDTGPGIPADYHERIFEPFMQVDGSETRNKSGTGLGLTITRELARLLGGTVGVDSAPGHGSTFTVELPLAAASVGGEHVGTA